MFLKRFSVQNKILATLAVPFLVILIAALVITWSSVDAWRDANQVRDVTRFVSQAEGLISVIQTERQVAVQVVAGDEDAKPVFEEIVVERNKALDQIDSLLEADGEGFDRIPDAAQDVLAELQNTLRISLEYAKDVALRGAATPQVLAESYDDSIALMLDFAVVLGNTIDDRAIADASSAYAAVYKYQDAVHSEQPLIYEIVRATKDGDASEARARDIALVVRQVNYLRADTLKQLVRSDIEGATGLQSLQPRYTAVRQLVGNASSGAVSDSLLDSWNEATAEEIDKITPIREWLRDAMEDSATDAANEARLQALTTIVIVVLVLALSLAIAYVTSRSITTPLRHLARAADQVKTELPRLVEQMAVPGQAPDFEIKPIAVESRDEVGQLAESFNAVNSTTIEVAREQAALRGSIAEMFVNVARRDHVLLNRQLGFLDELERAEEDPNTLASLFRLDHLATRMRRNSESLLVLAGIDSGRRIRNEMAMSDVVRTASSEIEQYDRIQLNLQTDPNMLGHNALNAAHLIAELLENATNFSEPHTPVEVTTASSKHFMTVTIRDYGLGMSADDIDEANRKVASRTATDVVGVQRVGLFVVGRIADRLGVHVAFSRPTDGSEGTVVVLSFPYTLFADQTDQSLPMPTDPLSRENQNATANWLGNEPEPEVVREVDLGALTDGKTTVGMPRRRVSAEPQTQGFTPQIVPEAAPLASRPGGLPTRNAAPVNASDLDEAAIVLPPLATPLAPVVSDANAPWQPDSQPMASSPVLPTRRANVQPVSLDPEPTEAAPQAPEQRSAMFSSFRSFTPGDTGVIPQDQINELAAAESLGTPAPTAPAAQTAPAPAEAAPAPAASAFFAPRTDAPAPSGPSAPEHQEVQFSGQTPPSFEPPVVVAHDAPPSFAPDQPEYGTDSALSAHSASSGAEWAERFANLPTRASRARAAHRGEDGEYAPETELPAPSGEQFSDPQQFAVHLEPEELWVPGFADEEPGDAGYTDPVAQPEANNAGAATTEAFEAPQYDSGVYEPTFELSETPLQGHAPQQDTGAQYGYEPQQPAAPQYNEAPLQARAPQQPAAPQYNEAPLQARAPQQPAAPQYNEAPLQARAPQQPAAPQYNEAQQYNEAPQNTGYGQPQNLPGIAQEGAPSNFGNAAHPFSPFSAPSAFSPTDQAHAPVAAFADIVSDGPARGAGNQQEKPGLIGRFFKKKSKNSGEPVGSGTPMQGTPTAPAPMGSSGFGNSHINSAGVNPAVGTSGASTQPAFGQSGSNFANPAPVSSENGYQPAASTQNQFENSNMFGAAPQQNNAGINSGLGVQRTPQPQAAPAASARPTAETSTSALPAPQTEFNPQGGYVPAFEQGAPLGGGGTTPASPAVADSQGHWAPPADFGQSAFALQSTIQEQAFAELSELSAYRPNAVAGSGTNLTRRVRSSIAGPQDDPSAQKISRDAAELRSRLSAFQSATARGRQDGISGASTEQGAQASELPARVPDSVNQ